MPSMPSKGPLSIQGGGPAPLPSDAAAGSVLRLRVADAVDCSSSGSALVHPDSCAAWAPFMQPTTLAVLAAGSDCVATVRADRRAAPGCLHVNMPLQHSMHVCPGENYDFRLFVPPANEPFALVELEAEVRLLKPDSTHGRLKVDERRLAQQLIKQHLFSVMAVGQLLVLQWEGVDVVARVTSTNTLDAAAQEEAVAYHCFRGLLMPDTAVLLSTAQHSAESCVVSACQQAAEQHIVPEVARLALSDAESSGAAALPGPDGEGGAGSRQSTAGGRLLLVNRQPRTSREPSASTVHVHTNDGEMFPVKRKLLRSCIALTPVVRSNEQQLISVQVDVDTLTFDRVLIFLEAQALGRPLPSFALHMAQDLLAASRTLGLRALEEVCEAKLGQSRDRLREYSFEEVQAANAAGSCWLILSGMILDVTRWLPEHPGGSTIIPAQALNIECSRFFEVYHVSRESFLYLKEFYIGELSPEDADVVPCEEQPSEDFKQQLRDYTQFRLQVERKTYKSF